MQPLTLSNFRAACQHVDDLSIDTGTDFGSECSPGFLYPGKLHIEDNLGKYDSDAPYCLTIGNMIYLSDRPHLEAILYGWAITELPDVFGLDIDGDAFRFICKLQDVTGPEQFAQALLRNLDEANAEIEHMRDVCDVDRCMIEVVSTAKSFHDLAIRRAKAWAEARPFIRG